MDSELFRNNSRGLEGGAFSMATLLNRKKAKLSKGKDDIDALKDFIVLKADARFAQYFISKHEINPLIDNTPDGIKHATNTAKVEFLHAKVEEALRDLLPMFNKCTGIAPDMEDFPVKQELRSSSGPNEATETMMMSAVIPESLVEATASKIIIPPPFSVEDYLTLENQEVSSRRSVKMYKCSLCGFVSSLKTVTVAHIRECWRRKTVLPLIDALSETHDPSDTISRSETERNDATEEEDEEVNGMEDKEDYYWNYKNGEFYVDSVFKLCLNFENYGNGAGMYIISKLMLPILHALGHSNYSNSIHRFICRVLTSTTPREAMLLVTERFVNRTGNIGENIFKDRRVEFRIRILKKLLSNLGPNMNTESIKKINSVIDIKEKLYHHARKVHGVTIRSGAHKARSDAKDYQVMMQALKETEADKFVAGRKFGNLQFSENLLEFEDFDQAGFFRWLTKKNTDAGASLKASHALLALPRAVPRL